MKHLVSILVFLSSVLTVCAQVNLNQGLIAYFPFNGNTNDASGGGNNGIPLNGVQLTTDRNGNANSAYSFDGIDDYIRVPNAPPFNQVNAFSIAFYFLPTQNTLQTMVGKISYSGGIGTQYQVGMGYSAQPGVYFGVNPPTTGCVNQIATNNNYVKTGTGTPSLNNWHCLAVSFDAGIQKIYLDGTLISTAAASFTTMNICSNSDMQIGSWWSGDPQFFKGKIDDLRFYNRALNQTEVSALCLTPCPAAPVLDFGYNQNICSPNSLQFTSNISSAQSYQWSFGDGQVNNSSFTPSHSYAAQGSYDVSLGVEYAPNCYTSIVKTIPVTNSFDNSIILSPDAAICKGDSIKLNTSSGFLDYCWQSSTGLPNPVQANGYVKPQTTTTYYLNTQSTGANLVINGNFSSGNTGFTSDYVNAQPNTTEGQYRVNNNPPSWNPGLTNCPDHTGSGGNMMMVNGSPTPNARIWSQTVSVTPNTNYAFSTWVQSLYAVNPANLKFSINNNIIGNNIQAGAVCNWIRFGTTWNSGAATSAVITIVNNNTVAAGNDFAIDDIFFGPILIKNDSVTITVNPLPAVQTIADAVICNGQSVQLTTTGALSYSWTPATGLSSATSNEPVAAPSVTTTYYVTGTDANGCKAKDTVVVTVNNCPTAIPGFTAPDTVCVNQAVNITNTSTGASTYYWNFCVASLNTAPSATNIGNPGSLSSPVFIDYAFYNGNYYGFLVNYNPGKLVRLNFGNSLLNTPTSTDLGNFGGIIPAGAGAEGIQIVFNENKWYAIIVGGAVSAGNSPRILKIEFGANLANLSPTATNWGNLGNMSQPIDLHVFKEGNNWYGFTVSADNNTFTRFNFTNSFDNTPTAVNLGNIGNLQYPTGIFAINDNGNWRVFVVNGGDITRTSANCSLTRLDFGSSLLNIPTGVNLGNPGNKLQHPRDLTIMKLCGQVIGFAVNGNPNYNDLLKLDFNNNLSGIPSITSLGSGGGLNFPHSISKLFRVENDVYSFITNVGNNTITRLKFTGCNSSSIPNTTAQTPPPIVYSTPGTYNINLTIDENLPSQAAVCKTVVVLPEFQHQPVQTINLCQGDSIRIGRSGVATSFTWSNGAVTDSIVVKTAGLYWIDMTRFGCSNRDSFMVNVNAKPVITMMQDSSICSGDSITLLTQATGTNTYSWTPVNGLSDPTVLSPSASPASTIQYLLTVTSNQNCVAKDSITITVKNPPSFSLGADRSICKGDSVLLNAGYAASSYIWQDGTNAPAYMAKDSGLYHVTLTLDGCSASDSIQVSFNPDPVIDVMQDTAICNLQSLLIQAQSNGNYTYSWSPSTGLSNPTLLNPTATVSNTITYILTAVNSFNCKAKDSFTLTNKPLPAVNLGPDTAICSSQPLILNAQNAGSSFLWNDGSTAQTLSVSAAGIYYVDVTKDGCTKRDSIAVTIKAKNFVVSPFPAIVCKDDSIRLTVNGGNSFVWFRNGAPLGLNDSSILIIGTTSALYSVQVTENQCGYSDLLSVPLLVKPLPAVSVEKSNDISCANPRAQLTAKGGIAYKWSPATGLSNDAVANPFVNPSANTWYYVRVTGLNGCRSVDSILVKTNAPYNGNFYVPSAFTPNRDGKNDCLSVKYGGVVTKLNFSVYTRWGDLVFKANSLSQCWDGKYNGKDAAMGVYVYYLEGTSNCGTVTQKGTITLIR